MPRVIPDWAAEYIGIPFAEHGRDHAGVDCWGLCTLIWRERFGLIVPGFDETYESAFDGSAVDAAIRTHGTGAAAWHEIAAGAERLGDAILCTGLYRVEGKWCVAPVHVGIVLAGGIMIHVESGIDTALARYRHDVRMQRRVVGFYRAQALDRDDNPS